MTAEEIRSHGLPLPEVDFLPVTLEEKLITYADTFYSKTPAVMRNEKPFEKVVRSISKHGTAAVARLMALHEMWQAVDGECK
ncbi:MAG: hypothetical protein KIG72_00230 [Bradymonadales bacterium]|nr:hypothetical protein [Bradymonadales bacterium]